MNHLFYEDKLKILALLEAHRLYVESKSKQEPISPDFELRVCEAIVAEILGFNNRVDWSEAIQNAGLIDYGYNVDKKQQYFNLSDIVKNIKI